MFPRETQALHVLVELFACFSVLESEPSRDEYVRKALLPILGSLKEGIFTLPI